MENAESKNYVLFSPVSDADPAKLDPNSNEVCRDGSMLHIARHYRPKKVLLYLTERFWEQEQKDRRFTRALHHVLPELSEADIQLHHEKDTELDPSKFDQFDRLFQELLEHLHRENKDATILLNLSSGTPQMQAALYIAAVTLPFPVEAAQVTTPVKDSNASKGKKPLPPDFLDRLGEDGALGERYTEDRSRAVSCVNVRRSILVQNITELVENYDYAAARTIYNGSKELFTPLLRDLINTAVAHINLDKTHSANSRKALEKADQALMQAFWVDFYEQPDKMDALDKKHKNLNRKMNGSLEITPKTKPCYDYLLYLHTLIKRQAFSDFARALSPALTTVIELRLAAADHPIEPFCWMDRKGVEHLSGIEIRKREANFKSYLDDKYHGEFKKDPLSAKNMLHYMTYLKQQYGVALDIDEFETLRYVESEVRNKAAHTLWGITSSDIKKMTNHTPQEILASLRTQYEKAIGVSGLQWNSLDLLNERIKAELKQLP